MSVFRAISSKTRWAIKSGLRWSGLIDVPIALIDAERLWRLGPIAAVAIALAAIFLDTTAFLVDAASVNGRLAVCFSPSACSAHQFALEVGYGGK
jgi:hypothetical protein